MAALRGGLFRCSPLRPSRLRGIDLFMKHSSPYVEFAAPIGQGHPDDLQATVSGKPRHVWGRQGPERERALVQDMPEDSLPVLLGAGLGCAIEALLEAGRPVAVIDFEAPLLEAAAIRKRFGEKILLLSAGEPEALIEALEAWQGKHGHKPFHPVAIPFHLRLRDGFYGFMQAALTQKSRPDFWDTARYPKFQSTQPRVLVLQPDYFLIREICTALDRMDVPYRTLPVRKAGRGSNEFVESLLKTVLEFKPDFVLTVNHLGLDRDGKFTELLERLGLPLASWFVDSPHLILYDYDSLASDNIVLFSYDSSDLAPMRQRGFAHTHWLPLATDPQRFRPGLKVKQQWRADVSFVGNSMQTNVGRFLDSARVPSELTDDWQSIAAGFVTSAHHTAAEYLRERFPHLWQMLQGVENTESRLAYESLITFGATRLYRHDCVRRILPFEPSIAGDDAWKEVLGPEGWRHIPRLDYYDELPGFYAGTSVSLNCTSMQMKGAVNQRVFDVPACGGFVLTDSRAQMDELFDPEDEFIAYATPDEIAPRIEELLENTKKRELISRNARNRILAEHTYEHRLKKLLRVMRESFS